MITAKIYLDTRSQKKDGSFPVKIYVSKNRKYFLVKTGLSGKSTQSSPLNSQ